MNNPRTNFMAATALIIVPFSAAFALSMLFAQVIHSMRVKQPIPANGLLINLTMIALAHLLSVLLIRRLWSVPADARVAGLSIAAWRWIFFAAYGAGLALFFLLSPAH